MRDKVSAARKRTATPSRALIDSGPLIALFNGGDRWHAAAQSWLLEHQRVRLVTTWPVLTEVCALLARRVHNEAALDFLRWIQRGAVELTSAEAATLDEVLAISERFADLPFDLADASIAEAAARLRIAFVVSIDADFDIYRDRRGQHLVNLLHRRAARGKRS